MFNALTTIGIPDDTQLLNDIFWVFDVNGDEVVDSKEFATIITLFRAYSMEDKIKSTLMLTFSFYKTG